MIHLSDRIYRGPLKAVIFDWAGTTVDYGSFAPTAVFLRLFESRGVSITAEQARVPMGLMKKDHLRAISRMPEVVEVWQAVHGAPCTEADIEAMYAEFVPLQLACLAEYAEPIHGTLEAVAAIRKMGMQIGTTTGYSREMMELLGSEAARYGYCPDNWVCPDDVPAGRPYPWMIYLNAIELQAYPLEALVKIGDTQVDIEEGLNAGTWTVGLALTGNGMGLSQAEVQALPVDELRIRRESIAAGFYQVGAHYVLDGIWDVPGVLEEIQRRLADGERP
jgi:phosphonoacetaldehyde hydrolase